ncbi:MAG: thiol-disulfide oxidoreductase DCC family protein [Chryseotalea sp.]|jgi:predicted DCC family thiol-disulfide oxidoreductase YuxK|nr:DCC1-like thiol-disulfide oxidoreductase family protein [Flammeovirgaceae bacterium]
MIVFFDGVCNLCTKSVQFIIERDKKKVFQFSSLQSAYAKRTLGFEATLQPPQSLLLVKENKVYSKSTAALLIAKELKGAWPLLTIFFIIPPFIRNYVYDWIAKNRYAWFGKTDQCWLPDPTLHQLFLEA